MEIQEAKKYLERNNYCGNNHPKKIISYLKEKGFRVVCIDGSSQEKNIELPFLELRGEFGMYNTGVEYHRKHHKSATLENRSHPRNISKEILAKELDELLIECINLDGLPYKGEKPLNIVVKDKEWLPVTELLKSLYKKQ